VPIPPYTLHFTKTQEAAAATIVTALAGAYTAIKARSFAVAALTGALITAVTAAAAFGFHPSAEVIGLPRPGPVSRCAG
jgi:hypothetical protein